MRASRLQKQVCQCLETLLNADGQPKDAGLTTLRELGSDVGDELVQALAEERLFDPACRALVALADLSIIPITQRIARRDCEFCPGGGACRGIGCGSLGQLVVEIFRSASAEGGNIAVRRHIESKTFGAFAAISKREFTCVGGYGACLEALGRCGLPSLEACKRAYPEEPWTALTRLQRTGSRGLERALEACENAISTFQFYIAHIAASFGLKVIPVLRRNFRSECSERYSVAAYGLALLGPRGVMAVLGEMGRLQRSSECGGYYQGVEELSRLERGVVPLLEQALRGRPSETRIAVVCEVIKELQATAKPLARRLRELHRGCSKRSSAWYDIEQALEKI